MPLSRTAVIQSSTLQTPAHRTSAPRKPYLRHGLTICIFAVCMILLARQFHGINFADVAAAFRDIGVWQWVAALGATWASFKALGRYDQIWHHALATNLCSRQAQTAGMTAVAVGQTLGLGTVTGALVRWQLLPQLTLLQITQLSICVSLSFMAAWCVIAALVAGVMFPQYAIFIWAALPLAALIWAVLRLWSRNPRVHMALRATPPILMMAALDLGFAALALWVLFPDPFVQSFALVFGAYVLALGAGLVSNTPGGAGAFDLALCTLLVGVAEADVLATLIAFRLAYYLVPALIGGGVLLRAYMRRKSAQHDISSHIPQRDLCAQGARTIGPFEGLPLVARSHLLGHNIIGPARPLGIATIDALAATRRGFTGLYKADARTAARAKARGWAVRKIACDAVLHPQVWSDAGSKMRQLRRKLRQATDAGVRITCPNDTLPVAAMSDIAQTWARSHGGELGYSMGRYTPEYVASQRVYLIWQHDALVGFITAQTTGRLWTLDLMRHLPRLQSGAIQLAIVAMIADAKSCGVQKLSLGAVPEGPAACPITSRFAAKRAGLRQFKTSFGCQFVPLYHVSPTTVGWAVSMAHAFVGIQRPHRRIKDMLLGHLTTAQARLIMIWKRIHLNAQGAHGSASHRSRVAGQ